MVAVCALTISRRRGEHAHGGGRAGAAAPPHLYWVVLAAVPSGLMLSTTTHLTTDIVPCRSLGGCRSGGLSALLRHRFRTPPPRGRRDRPRSRRLFLIIAGGFAFSDGSNLPFFTATLGLILLARRRRRT